MLRRLRIENLVLIREAELELDPGLNAITGETGAGKTILSNAIGLLLGAKGEAALIGPASDEAYVEAELDLPDDEVLGELAELRPEGEETLVLARRIFADGRTRAYAWGRSAAREDVAAAVEALLAMSGQFEQRRLARPGLPARDARRLSPGTTDTARAARRAWRELTAARRAHDELTRDAAAAEARLEELRALVADTEGLEPGRGGRPPRRAGAAAPRHRARARRRTTALEALALDGARGRRRPRRRRRARRGAARGDRAGARRGRRGAPRRGALAAGGGDRPAPLPRLARGRAGAARGGRGAARADRRPAPPLPAPTRYAELLERAAAARAELEALAEGHDPARAAAEALAAQQAEVDRLHAEPAQGAPRRPRRGSPRRSRPSSSGVGLGEGEFRVDVREVDPGPSGADEAVFSVRPNSGLPFGPVAETASGGELSRIALAIAAVGGGETMVFDEIDAGIGGQTAHAVGETLRRLAGRAQVITITHLPQIASLADRHFRVEKVPGDPTHTRIEPLGRRAPRGARAHARRRRFLATLRTRGARLAGAGVPAEPYHLSTGGRTSA